MKKRPTLVGLFSFGGLWGKGPQWALPLLAHLAGGLMSRPAVSGPAGAWPWHQIACQISRPQAAYPCAPAARNAGKGPACGALAGGVEIAAPQGRRGAAWTRPQTGAAGERPACRQPRLGRCKRRGAGGGYAGRRGRRQSRACKASAAGGAGRHGWPERRRPGRRGGRPHSPHTVGAGPPRSTCAATGTGEEQSKARCKRPRRGLALLCGGVPPCNG